jgi:glucokinase
MLLAGDIGGTKTNLAVFSSETGWRKPYAEATYASVDYPDLELLVHEFLAQHDFPIDRASFGVAGPVVAGHASITNLSWMMDEHQPEFFENPPIELTPTQRQVIEILRTAKSQKYPLCEW